MKKIILLLIFFSCIILSSYGQKILEFYQTSNHGDIIYRNTERGAGGRLIVAGSNNSVIFNFLNEFSGGLYIGGNNTEAVAVLNANANYPILFNRTMKANAIYSTDKIGIGIENPTERLEVNGKIRAKEIKIEAENWPDYVFEKNYQLPSLSDVENYIKEKNHLPNIPSAAEVEEKGVNVGEMQETLLKKVEELTLYLIEQDKRIKKQEERIDTLLKELEQKQK